MNESALLDALRSAMQKVPGQQGVTARDLKTKLGWGDDVTRRTLRELVEAGAVVCARERRMAIDGVMRVVPTYRLVAKAKGRK